MSASRCSITNGASGAASPPRVAITAASRPAPPAAVPAAAFWSVLMPIPVLPTGRSWAHLAGEQHLEGAKRVQFDELEDDQTSRGQRQPSHGSLGIMKAGRLQHQDRAWAAGRVHLPHGPAAVQLPQGGHLLAGVTADLVDVGALARAADREQFHGFTTFLGWPGREP